MTRLSRQNSTKFQLWYLFRKFLLWEKSAKFVGSEFFKVQVFSTDTLNLNNVKESQ